MKTIFYITLTMIIATQQIAGYDASKTDPELFRAFVLHDMQKLFRILSKLEEICNIPNKTKNRLGETNYLNDQTYTAKDNSSFQRAVYSSLEDLVTGLTKIQNQLKQSNQPTTRPQEPHTTLHRQLQLPESQPPTQPATPLITNAIFNRIINRGPDDNPNRIIGRGPGGGYN